MWRVPFEKAMLQGLDASFSGIKAVIWVLPPGGMTESISRYGTISHPGSPGAMGLRFGRLPADTLSLPNPPQGPSETMVSDERDLLSTVR
jgi:hypothetical protein